jgi:hypothetical protein
MTCARPSDAAPAAGSSLTPKAATNTTAGQRHKASDPHPVMPTRVTAIQLLTKLVPMEFKTFGGRKLVLVVFADSKARYEGLVGHAADLTLNSTSRRRMPAGAGGADRVHEPQRRRLDRPRPLGSGQL